MRRPSPGTDHRPRTAQLLGPQRGLVRRAVRPPLCPGQDLAISVPLVGRSAPLQLPVPGAQDLRAHDFTGPGAVRPGTPSPREQESPQHTPPHTLNTPLAPVRIAPPRDHPKPSPDALPPAPGLSESRASAPPPPWRRGPASFRPPGRARRRATPDLNPGVTRTADCATAGVLRRRCREGTAGGVAKAEPARHSPHGTLAPPLTPRRRPPPGPAGHPTPLHTPPVQAARAR